MEVKVKRNTGIMGGATKIAVLVDGQEEVRLKNNEEHLIRTDQANIHIQAKSGFMGSKVVETTTNATFEIKVNPICLLLFVLSMALIFTAGMTDVREMKLVLASVGIVSAVGTLIYSISAWFVLRKS